MYDQQPTSYRNRRSSHSGPGGFAPSQSFAPHNNDFRRDGFSNQYNDPYGSGSAFSESYPQSNGFAGSSYPPPGIMNTSYSMGTPAAYPDSYDSSPLSDNFFPPPMDDGFSARGRTLSTGGGGFGPPALLPPTQSMTPYTPHHFSKRGRRSSSVGPGMGLGGYAPDPFRRPGGVNVKFRLKGGYRQGISLSEATDSARLSRSMNYSMHDLAPDHRGRITLKVRWAGYRSLTYEIPISAEYDGYVNLQSLARRIARAIGHFMTSNHIALPWERVTLHRLEEITPGIWIPVLTTH